MKFRIFTLFPEMFPGVLGYSLTGKALQEGKWQLETVNIRDYAEDKHKTVDDTPYGGGAGMLMQAEIIARALEANIPNPQQADIFYLSPRGRIFDQPQALAFSRMEEINFLCGRYEGVDQRVLDYFHIREISIGNFVLTGGELACMMMMDSCLRYLPDLLGNATSLLEESFGGGYDGAEYENLLEYPQYTKPRVWRGLEVPPVLCSGNHKLIREWRHRQAQELTAKVRGKSELQI